MVHPRVFETATTLSAGTTANTHYQGRRYSGASATLKRSPTVEFRGSSATNTPASEDASQLRKIFYWFTSITKISSQQKEKQKQQKQHIIVSKKATNKKVSAGESGTHQQNASTTITDTTESNNTEGRGNKFMRGLRSPIGKRRIRLVRHPLTSP